ncbi:TPA: hypothetical protein ACN331_002600 [Vibrio parahaemolyticus]|uniref:hypothetical protein n=1 Tax=Vibrio parahaemolyticus TaxID=670 RepID=UPI001110D161|nr:hypothetical protein [Vibrio parahaemolyticus]MBE4384956.1 hypothetical protein [Vibrio parahaemolyticus]MEA5230276.1 hypothetical protein [Vibrio parahaemolyticus]NYU23953.1 hypothetical protein [Vibrio parahaemolyticus]TMX39594.1 hypothetical protein DA098_09915 [Vibrio parahaemolyticus]TMX80340.1 hypothetical protein DA094_02060 [Vibrio parahaemolyticus]
MSESICAAQFGKNASVQKVGELYEPQLERYADYAYSEFFHSQENVLFIGINGANAVELETLRNGSVTAKIQHDRATNGLMISYHIKHGNSELLYDTSVDASSLADDEFGVGSNIIVMQVVDTSTQLILAVRALQMPTKFQQKVESVVSLQRQPTHSIEKARSWVKSIESKYTPYEINRLPLAVHSLSSIRNFDAVIYLN